MEQQPDQQNCCTEAPALNLIELPENCMSHTLGFMDPATKKQLFKSSKACAVLVLSGCTPVYCSQMSCQPKEQPPPKLLHWAAQVSTGLRLRVMVATEYLTDSLRSLLVFNHGGPDAYPGITSLELSGVTCQSLIPHAIAAAFPNLRRLEQKWLGHDQGSLQVQHGCLPHLHHLAVTFRLHNCAVPAITHHIAQQLAHLPSLVSLEVPGAVIESAQVPVLEKLTHLAIETEAGMTDQTSTALRVCSQLRSLALRAGFFQDRTPHWLPGLPQLLPHIQELHMPGLQLTDGHMPHILALRHITALTVFGICTLSVDNSSHALCSWRRLKFVGPCNNDITKLPLHTLDSPVECSSFDLTPTHDHAADMAAVRAAQPHLTRCGGIRMDQDAELKLDCTHTRSIITHAKATALLEEWAPCLAEAPQLVKSHYNNKWAQIPDAVAKVWPQARQLPFLH